MKDGAQQEKALRQMTVPVDPEREMSCGRLAPEDIIENQKITLAKFAAELEQLQREKRQLEEELRIARSDRRELEAAITNYFVNHYRGITGDKEERHEQE